MISYDFEKVSNYPKYIFQNSCGISFYEIFKEFTLLDKQCGQKGGIFPFCGIFGPKGGTDF